MSFTLVETKTGAKRSPVAIKPYFDGRLSNMGLEQYGLSLFEGVTHYEQTSLC